MANKKEILRGLKYEIAALPLMVAAPIAVTIGWKAIKADDNYLFAVIGGLLTIAAILIAIKGIRIILNGLFE